MTSLETVGSSHQVGSPRGDAAPVVRAPELQSEQPVEKGERAEKRPQAQRVELPTRAFHARLGYDRETEEVVVEILDPQTGDVLTRLPAKELPDDIRALVSDNGPLVETIV